MGSKAGRSIILAFTGALAALLLWVSLLVASPALADSRPQPQQAPPEPFELSFAVVFTDPALQTITDLEGNPLGQGIHVGRVKCAKSNCSQKTDLNLLITVPTTNSYVIEYKFATRLASDPDAGRVVVGGVGTIIGQGMKERFAFTAIFTDLEDGTIRARYEASRPDASYILPNAPGALQFTTR